MGDGVGNPGGNIFADNGNNGEIYALYNNSSFPIMALHNCWIEGQLSTTDDVEDVIFTLLMMPPWVKSHMTLFAAY